MTTVPGRRPGSAASYGSPALASTGSSPSTTDRSARVINAPRAASTAVLRHQQDSSYRPPRFGEYLDRHGSQTDPEPGYRAMGYRYP
jgi:hypothetical protein